MKRKISDVPGLTVIDTDISPDLIRQSVEIETCDARNR